MCYLRNWHFNEEQWHIHTVDRTFKESSLSERITFINITAWHAGVLPVLKAIRCSRHQMTLCLFLHGNDKDAHFFCYKMNHEDCMRSISGFFSEWSGLYVYTVKLTLNHNSYEPCVFFSDWIYKKKQIQQILNDELGTARWSVWEQIHVQSGLAKDNMQYLSRWRIFRHRGKSENSTSWLHDWWNMSCVGSDQ